MSDVPNDPSRRRFLLTTSAVAATAAATGLPACSSDPPPGPIDAGAVSDFTVGRVRVSPLETSIFVGRDAAGGFYAYTRRCTHMGCTIPAPSANSSLCPCHNSTYDSNGDVTRMADGFANQMPLRHFVVTFTGSGATARVIVDTSMTQVDRSNRVAPPA